eukprot:RCo035875
MGNTLEMQACYALEIVQLDLKAKYDEIDDAFDKCVDFASRPPAKFLSPEEMQKIKQRCRARRNWDKVALYRLDQIQVKHSQDQAKAEAEKAKGDAAVAAILKQQQQQ